MQREKTVQRDAGEQIVAADPCHNILAKVGNGAE